jgi:uncharacterized protein (TIGR00730 family)
VKLKNVCVYCGSSVGDDPAYATAAVALGRELAARGVGLVYGAGNVGLMGVVADAALAAGGKVVGVIPEALARWEVAHGGLTEIHVVQTMHERKALMADLSDAFIALPGGFGTLEELFEVLTWTQLGFHRDVPNKPCGILNVAGFYDPLLAFLDGMVERRFLRPEHRALALAAPDVHTLLAALEDFAPPAVPKWWDRELR